MQETTQPGPGGAPVCALDPFADGFLHDPFSFHNELREAGPVVWLEHYGIWGMARYAEVHEALRDCERYSSAAGVGLSDFRWEKPWRPPSLLLEADPPAHPPGWRARCCCRRSRAGRARWPGRRAAPPPQPHPQRLRLAAADAPWVTAAGPASVHQGQLGWGTPVTAAG